MENFGTVPKPSSIHAKCCRLRCVLTDFLMRSSVATSVHLSLVKPLLRKEIRESCAAFQPHRFAQCKACYGVLPVLLHIWWLRPQPIHHQTAVWPDCCSQRRWKRSQARHGNTSCRNCHHLRQKPPRKDNRRAFELTESTVDKGCTHSSQDKFVYLSLYLLSFGFRRDALGLQALSSGMKRGASCTAAPASIQHRAKQLAVEASFSKKSTRGKNSLLVDTPMVLVECVCENGCITRKRDAKPSGNKWKT